MISRHYIYSIYIYTFEQFRVNYCMYRGMFKIQHLINTINKVIYDYAYEYVNIHTIQQNSFNKLACQKQKNSVIVSCKIYRPVDVSSLYKKSHSL